MAEPLLITDENFEIEVLQSPIPVVIDFWAEWCGPCKALTPAINEITKEYAGKCKVGKLNVDNSPNISIEYGIRSIPCVIFFKDGKEIDRIIGLVPKDKITDKIDSIL